MNKTIIYLLLITLLYFNSCGYFQKKEIPEKVVARVENDYLFEDEIKDILPKNYSVDDSLRITKSYINNWVLKKLLMIKAQENLSNTKKQNFEKLINQYRNDLYTQSYIEMLVAQQLDTIITKKQKEDFYHQNSSIFKLNEDLLKLRYIQLPNEYIKYKDILEKLNRFSNKDKIDLENQSLHFISSFLNDSIWVKATDVYEKLPFLKTKIENKTINSGTFLQERDSLGNFIIKIEKILIKNQTAPLQYIDATLRQIILNQRKLEHIKELEKGIINTAIKRKQIEYYE